LEERYKVYYSRFAPALRPAIPPAVTRSLAHPSTSPRLHSLNRMSEVNSYQSGRTSETHTLQSRRRTFLWSRAHDTLVGSKICRSWCRGWFWGNL